ncbi:MAG: PIN domain-containing protein [bacterium]
MILAVDTNVFLDILIPNSNYLSSSLNCLTNIGPSDELIICEIVFSELAAQFLSFSDIRKFLQDTGIKLIQSNAESLFEASRAWKIYIEGRKHLILCPSCGKHQKCFCQYCKKTISYRQHILSDFLIGAHAKMLADRLITRDRGFYRKYFDDLVILHP